MKVYPGNLLMKAMGLSPEDKGKYYEAVFHLWQSEALLPVEMEVRIGTISEPLRQRFDVREDGKLHMVWLDNEREVQTKTASKNSLNRSGKRKITSGKTTGKTSGQTTPKRTPVPVALPIPKGLEQVWEEFKAHRRELKKPVTERSERGMLKELEAMGLERATAAIQHSIANGWQGIFEPRANGSHKAEDMVDGTPVSTFEKFRTEFHTREGRYPNSGDQLPKGYKKWQGWI